MLITGEAQDLLRCTPRDRLASWASRGSWTFGFGAAVRVMIEGAEFVAADIRDEEALAQAGDADAVIHCAAMVGPALGKAEPQRSVDVNDGRDLRARAGATQRRGSSTCRRRCTAIDRSWSFDEDFRPIRSACMTPSSSSWAKRSAPPIARPRRRRARSVLVTYGFGSRIGQYFVPRPGGRTRP